MGINKKKLSLRLTLMIGTTRAAKIQQWLKYKMSFRKFYRVSKLTELYAQQQYIFMIDGKTTHGGLSDRLRGLLGLYDFCHRQGAVFKIHWVYPFRLEKYLIPNEENWIIKDGEICYNSKIADFRFVNGYSNMDNKQLEYAKLMKSNKQQVHVYANNTLINRLEYSKYFHHLFIPSEELSRAINFCRKEMNVDNYISCTFRFQALLGDFFEGKFPVLSTEQERFALIRKCLSFLEKLISEHPGQKILVTSDSSRFISEAKKYKEVYCIPGEVKHMDFVKDNGDDGQLKSFVDLFMLMESHHLYSYTTGPMFASTGFALTASLLGGHPFTEVRE